MHTHMHTHARTEQTHVSPDPLHYGFIEAGANLRAALIGIPPERDAAVIRGLIEAAPVPEYAPKHLKVQTDEKQKVSLASEEDGQVIARLVEETPRDVNAGAFVPAEFEKVWFERESE